MRLIVSLVLLLAVSHAATCRMFSKKLYQTQTDLFGREFSILESNGFSNTVINVLRAERLFNPELATHNIIKMNEFLVQNKGTFQAKESDVIECSPNHPDFFKFAATTVALLKPNQNSVKINSFCFKDVAFSMTNVGSNTLQVEISAHNKRSLACSETFIITTGKHFHMPTVVLAGEHRYTFEGLTADEMTYMSFNGVRFMRFCDSITHFLPNLLMTAQMFLGGLGLNPKIPFFGSHVPMEMQHANVKFIKEATGFQWRERNPTFIPLDPKYIQSGDHLSITRFDGLDNIIHWGAGSHQGHSVIAIWDHTQEPAQLYIVESQDAWYWPTKGLQRTKYEDWIKHALDADFNIAILPLKKEYAAKFSEDKAWEWFRQTQGMPYGYRNFLFGWMDTPKDNLPSVLDLNWAYLVFRILEAVDQPATNQLLREALNWRVGTKNLELFEIEEEANKQGKTLNDLFSIIEPEGVMYSDGYSYVCSSYVFSFYTKSGMLGDLQIHATEMTPRDVYTLNIYDTNWEKPQVCQNADPELPYCQIMGNWKMDLPGYSTIEPYSHMCERCPSMAPDYFRPDGC